MFIEIDFLKLVLIHTGKSKATKKVKASHAQPKCPSCGKDLPSKNQKCMCQFVTVAPTEKETKSTSKSLEELLDDMTLCSAASKKKTKELKETPITITKSKVANNSEKLKKLLTQVSEEEDHKSASPTLDCGLESTNIKAVGTMLLQSGSPSSVRNQSPKFSFENLLDDVKWTIDDFEIEEEGDLSDIVQSITGRRRSTDAGTIKMSGLLESPEETCDEELENFETESETGLRTATPEAVFKSKCGDSSDDEAPYTPLIDRVRKLQGNKVPNKRHSVVAAMKLRRFSESFDAFCMGDNATSSPRVSVSSEAEISNGTVSGPSAITFSLGITKLLEDST